MIGELPLYHERRESAFSALTETIGRKNADALRELYKLYDERIYELFASLWDGKVGGFYFSVSARDNEPFLPDIESTVQVLRFMGTSGLFENYSNNLAEALPERMKNAIISFAKSLQSEDDGYFYHPQWGTDIIASRRGRDLGWCTGIIKELGDAPLYDTPSGVKGTLGAPKQLQVENGESKASVLPEYLQDTRKFVEYMDSLNLRERSYSGGNTLAAQNSQIKAAGQEFVDTLFDYLDSHQCSENGLWQPDVHYNSVNGLMKIQMLYTYFSRPLPNAERALENSILATISDENPTGITSVYNPWVCIGGMLSNIKQFVGAERYEYLLAKLRERAPEMICATYEKLKPYKRDDGGFSYNKVHVVREFNVSQSAPIAPGDVFESGVNGTCLGSTGPVRQIFWAINAPVVPFYCAKDYDRFLEIAGEK